MKQTDNLKLNKPEYEDFADVKPLNDNADILDAAIADHVNAVVGTDEGVHNVRYCGEALQVFDVDKDEWIDISADVKPESIGAATTELYTAILLASSWAQQSDDSYWQSTDVIGMKPVDVPIVDILLTSNNAIARDELIEYAKISRVETWTDALWVTCFDEQPQMDLALFVRVVR